MTLIMKTEKPEKEYQTPKIRTYTEEEILELIGPANTAGSLAGNDGLHLGWEKGKGNPH
jgi:hypothetical protein